VACVARLRSGESTTLSVTGSGQKKGGDARPIRLGASGSENQGKASINFRDANLQSGHRRKNSAWYPLFRSLTGVNRTWPERPVSVVIDPFRTWRTGQFGFVAPSNPEKHQLCRPMPAAACLLPGRLVALHSSSPRPSYISRSLIVINAGSFGGELVNYIGRISQRQKLDRADT
jgi:hypothetical protein